MIQLYALFLSDCVYDRTDQIVCSLFFTWMIYLLIIILRLICNYVRAIGLFPITGYCSNTTSCTEKHCELKSNKVCHCYGGKPFSFSFFCAYPNFSWHVANENYVHCCIFFFPRSKHGKNITRQTCRKHYHTFTWSAYIRSEWTKLHFETEKALIRETGDLCCCPDALTAVTVRQREDGYHHSNPSFYQE